MQPPSSGTAASAITQATWAAEFTHFCRDAEVNNCSFFDNTASHGGGLLLTDSIAYIASSTFSGNVGIISGSDGGAIALLGTNAEIADCNITNNRVGGSGGGIYISSKNVDGGEIEGDNSVLVKNCLITGNVADLDGGGISATWHSRPQHRQLHHRRQHRAGDGRRPL